MKSKSNIKWNPDLAYIVGLMCTDGNLSNDGRHLCLRSKDIKLLKTFKNCLGIKNKIAKTNHDSWAKNKVYRIQFGNVKFYRWLLKIGLSPAKTYSIGRLKIPNKYFRDFLRGHIDGDGSIYSYVDKYHCHQNPKYIYNRLYVSFLSASQEHICWLRENINKNLGISGDLSNRKPIRPDQKATMWRLRFAKKDSLILLRWIYYSNKIPCLERKRSIANQFLLFQAP